MILDPLRTLTEVTVLGNKCEKILSHTTACAGAWVISLQLDSLSVTHQPPIALLDKCICLFGILDCDHMGGVEHCGVTSNFFYIYNFYFIETSDLRKTFQTTVCMQ